MALEMSTLYTVPKEGYDPKHRAHEKLTLKQKIPEIEEIEEEECEEETEADDEKDVDDQDVKGEEEDDEFWPEDSKITIRDVLIFAVVLLVMLSLLSGFLYYVVSPTFETDRTPVRKGTTTQIRPAGPAGAPGPPVGAPGPPPDIQEGAVPPAAPMAPAPGGPGGPAAPPPRPGGPAARPPRPPRPLRPLRPLRPRPPRPPRPAARSAGGGPAAPPPGDGPMQPHPFGRNPRFFFPPQFGRKAIPKRRIMTCREFKTTDSITCGYHMPCDYRNPKCDSGLKCCNATIYNVPRFCCLPD